MDYQIIDCEDAPQEILSWLEENYDKEDFIVTSTELNTFVLIARGEVCTGGHHIEIISLEELPEKLLFKIKYSKPVSGEVVIQVITYPSTIIQLPKTDKVINIEIIKD